MTGTITKWRQMQREIHETAKSKGWYDNPPSFFDRIALIHSEISEALESYRNNEDAHFTRDCGKPDGYGIELADAVIRIMDCCEYMNLDLEALMLTKMAYNKTRPFRHGGKKI